MITKIIKPINLLRGTHDDTAQTGQGCFMNVIAYLNGEPQITDQSDCVCYVVRPIAIWLNDYLKDEERHLMIPFIERAMGSRSDDKNEVIRRVKLVVKFSNIAAKYAKYAAVIRKTLIDAAFEFLDNALPKEIKIEKVVSERAKKLMAINTEG